MRKWTPWCAQEHSYKFTCSSQNTLNSTPVVFCVVVPWTVLSIAPVLAYRGKVLSLEAHGETKVGIHLCGSMVREIMRCESVPLLLTSNSKWEAVASRTLATAEGGLHIPQCKFFSSLFNIQIVFWNSPEHIHSSITDFLMMWVVWDKLRLS